MSESSNRNLALDLDMEAIERDWRLRAEQVGESQSIISSLEARSRSLSPAKRREWLLLSIRCLDLATLSGSDTPERVQKLCARARSPLGGSAEKIAVASVCVYPNLVYEVKESLENSGVLTSSVAGGFPAGQTPLSSRLEEIKFAKGEGAEEIDLVIWRSLALQGKWEDLHEELRQMREACGSSCMKAILGAGDLDSDELLYKASRVAMMARANFIKTSTGMESVNATLPFGLIMCWAIRDHEKENGFRVGLKPAGGLKKAQDALDWMALVEQELGEEWLSPSLFRLGASSLLDDLESELK